MRKDPVAYSHLFNLLAVLSLAGAVLVAVAGSRPQVDVAGRAIAISAGLWLATLCRAAAVAFDRSHRVRVIHRRRSTTLKVALSLDARRALGAVGAPE